MTGRTEIEMLLMAASAVPDRVAVRFRDLVLTYQDLVAVCGRVARSLTDAGVTRDDVVAILLENGPDFIAAYFGAQWVGATAMPLNPREQPKRIAHCLARAQARALIVGDERPLAPLAGTPGAQPDRQVLAFEPSGSGVCHPALAAGPAPPVCVVGEDDVSVIMFTTGTTGESKGVKLRHRNTLAATRGIVEFLRMEDGVVEVLPTPLYHSFGLGRMRSVLACRGTLVLARGFVFPARLMGLVEGSKATGFASVPAGWELLLRTDTDRVGQAFRSLRYVEIGSAPMARRTKETLLNLLPDTRICMHYGLTEASRTTFMEFHESASDLDTIGTPLKGVEVSIRDGAGAPLPDASEGEICVRGATVFGGYVDGADATHEAFFGDWFRTGDLGRRGQTGRLYLSGRLKDVINLAGLKVSPREIEEVLDGCTGVQESAVVGVPTEGVTGEAIHAFVVPTAPDAVRPERLLAFAARYLEPGRRPLAVHLVTSLPKTESGKLQRAVLRELLQRGTR
jgi:long-chain acyl-CoA synthetase